MYSIGGKALRAEIGIFKLVASFSTIKFIVDLAFILVIIIDKKIAKIKTSFLADCNKY